MKKRYVLVTTSFRGVFAGMLVAQDGGKVTLENARCAIYWNTKKGFLELAEFGPNSGSRIGSVAPKIELFGVTSISDVTASAKTAWENA